MQNLYRTLIVLFVIVSAQFTSAQVVSSLVQNIASQRMEAITLNHNGFLYAPGAPDGTIYKVASDGSSWSSIATGLGVQFGGAVDADTNFYVSDYNSGRIVQIRPDDSWAIFASGFSGPTGIVAGPTGDTLYVANYVNDAIYKLSLTDSSVTPWIQGNGISGPDGLVFDTAGNLYIANFDDNRIHKATPNGQVSLFATLPSTANSGYLTLVDSTFYITSFYNHKIFSIDMSGTAQLIAGTGTPGFQNGAAAQARFSQPNGIAASVTGDSLFITDGNAQGQIRVLDLAATPVGVAELPVAGADSRIVLVAPNPVREGTQIRYFVAEAGVGRMYVVDAQGREVAVLREGWMDAGEHVVRWDVQAASRLGAGVYVVVLGVGGVFSRKKVVLSR